jgi:putative copper export protein
MEHSALHALLLTGLIAALGGVLAMWWLIIPAARALGAEPERDALTSDLSACVARWVFRGALAAAMASGLDLFVQVAELEGQTIFGGVDVRLVARFATQTTVGQLALLRIVLLLLTAAAVGVRSTRKWPLAATLALGAVLATSLVSHAAAQPERRVLAVAMQIAHLCAACGWIGVLLHLFAARGILLADDSKTRVRLIAEIVRRFSPLALITTALLAITGLLAAWRFLGATGALFTSAYGLTLLVKLALLAPALVAGWIHFRHIRPQLLRLGPDMKAVLQRFVRTLELEITAGILVIAVAGILASVSPPGDDGALQLTPAQTRAVLTPDLPTSRVENWTLPEDPRGPTTDDLRYSEFTHNWSGVFVVLLALGWLAQATGGRWSTWAGRACPFLLLPFGVFIAIAANPELWILRLVSPWEALTNPSILEHQLGALLVFLLAGLSWRDLRNPERLRPLGYALPVIMIAGSLLLLGHAHSALAVPDELTNLINVQHALLGACGLFAGTARWFVLRGLLPSPIGNLLWPGWIIVLGLFMAFFYREVI